MALGGRRAAGSGGRPDAAGAHPPLGREELCMWDRLGDSSEAQAAALSRLRRQKEGDQNDADFWEGKTLAQPA